MPRPNAAPQIPRNRRRPRSPAPRRHTGEEHHFAINKVAEAINNDLAVGDKLKVVFLPGLLRLGGGNARFRRRYFRSKFPLPERGVRHRQHETGAKRALTVERWTALTLKSLRRWVKRISLSFTIPWKRSRRSKPKASYPAKWRKRQSAGCEAKELESGQYSDGDKHAFDHDAA